MALKEHITKAHMLSCNITNGYSDIRQQKHYLIPTQISFDFADQVNENIPVHFSVMHE